MDLLLEEIRRHSLALGERPALVCGEEEIPWGCLWPWAESLAARLRRAGEGPVAVEAPREAWVPAAFLACLIAGRPYLPLDPALPALRRAELLRRTGAQPLDRGGAYAGFLAGERCTPPADGQRLAYLLFTSGSTGAPKEVAVSCRNLENFLRWAKDLPGLAAAAGTAVGHAGFSFDLSVADLYLSLLLGGAHVGLTAGELGDLSALSRRLTAAGVTFLAATPSFLRLCLRDGDFSRETLPGLETVFSCGEALPPRTALTLLERFPGLKLWNAYGPTEAACAVCAARIDREMCAAGALPIGRVGEGAVEISLEDGQLILRGDSVAPAYGGVYPTGDRGFQRDGLLYWSGRLDDQIKYKGYRVEPAEIEAALEALPGVERAAVLPRPGRDGQVRGLTAFLEGAALPDGRTLATLAAERLPRYMVPGEWRRLERLPLTPNGKCDRKRLKGMLE